MKTVSHLLFGNHPKSGKLKERTKQIIAIMKESGGKINAVDLEQKLGLSRTDTPSMFYKPLAAMRRWSLLQTHKSVVFDESGKKHFKTEYELTPDSFYNHVEKTMMDQLRKEMGTVQAPSKKTE